MKKEVIIIFCVVLALTVCVFGHEHEHGHGHSHEHDHEHPHHEHHHHGHEDGHEHDHHGHDHHGHDHHGHHDHGHHGHHHEHHPHEHHDGHYHDDIEEGSVFNRYSREMNDPEVPTASPKTKMPLPPKPSRSTMVIWMEALCSTILISAAPFFILFFIPLTGNTAEQKPLLKILLAFASGGLLGDAFLHLIPHAINPHSHLEEDHGHSHDHGHGGHSHSSDMIVGFWVLGGIIAFLIVEKFVRYVKGGHGHSHGHQPPSTKTTDNEVVKKDDETVRKRKKTEEDKSKEDDNTKENDQTKINEEEPKEIKVAGYLNLAADFTHNFTDGLAIGASFLVSRNLGIVTTLTILLHEVPHEIGDFAILVQSGCTKKKAMYLQLSTATGAIAGTVCGLLAHNIGSSATLWILPFTAGGFIYIATVSVIPELLGDSKIGQSIKEVIGLLFGVFMMVVIAQLE